MVNKKYIFLLIIIIVIVILIFYYSKNNDKKDNTIDKIFNNIWIINDKNGYVLGGPMGSYVKIYKQDNKINIDILNKDNEKFLFKNVGNFKKDNNKYIITDLFIQTEEGGTLYKQNEKKKFILYLENDNLIVEVQQPDLSGNISSDKYQLIKK